LRCHHIDGLVFYQTCSNEEKVRASHAGFVQRELIREADIVGWLFGEPQTTIQRSPCTKAVSLEGERRVEQLVPFSLA